MLLDITSRPLSIGDFKGDIGGVFFAGIASTKVGHALASATFGTLRMAENAHHRHLSADGEEKKLEY